MDPDPPLSTPRQVRFRPKGPPRRTSKPVVTSSEPVAGDEDSEETQQALSTRAREHLAGRRPGAAKKSPAQVAFTHGVTATGIRAFGKQKERADARKGVAKYEESTLDDTQIVDASMSTSGSNGEDPESSARETTMKEKKEYREPWDYENSNYPITLPLRPPYSGDPELLDKEEFEKPEDYDENTIHAASELGLLDEDDEPKMIFLQLPRQLPLITKPTSTRAQERPNTCKGKEIATGNPTDTRGKKAGGYTDPHTGHLSAKGLPLEELPGGYIGKMLVYKSGAVKMKLGDSEFDVNPGTKRQQAEIVVAVNTSSRHLCEVRELKKHGVITPNIDALVD